MITLSNVGISFQGTPLFQGVTFMVKPKDRIGLVGKNGAGKSTLMKILTGQIDNYEGTIDINSGVQTGYLPQEMRFEGEMTVKEEAMKAFAQAERLQREIDELNTYITTSTDYESDKYADAVEQMTAKYEELGVMDTSKGEGEAEQILKGLGFAQEELDKSIATFSGGWQMRVELTKLLLAKPDLLLLDEPTNHLDIESIMWLENFLANYEGAIVLISHDRKFLDTTCNRTVEIVNGKIYDYAHSYTKFVELRQERIDHQRAAAKNQEQFVNQQERFIERFRAKNTKATLVQSKIRQLEKLEKIEVDDTENASIKFNFPQAVQSGKVPLLIKEYGKAYGDKRVLKNVDITVERGDRIAFVGKNGQGKTTLVRSIIGELEHEGEVALGHNAQLGYYAQIQEKTLDKELTIQQTIEKVAHGEWGKLTNVRSLLGAFLFGNEEVDKKVKVLSGGEKSRLAIAKLLIQESNLLILDEPTNHLDMTSKDVLKDALNRFDGTVIVVSHDREFLQGLTTKTYEFTKGKVKEHLGPIEDFLKSYQLESFRQFEQEEKQAKAAKQKSNDSNDYKKRKQGAAEQRKLQKAVQQYEKQITELEGKVKAFEVQLADPDFYKSDSQENKSLIADHTAAKTKLEGLESKWAQAVEDLEGLA